MITQSDFIHDTLANSLIKRVVERTVKNKSTDLKIERLKNVFSEGDMKNDPIIQNITEKVKTAQREL